MKKSKKVGIIMGLIAIIITIMLIYAFFIETKKLIIKNENIVYENFSKDEKLKIVQFTDVHLISENNKTGYKIDDFAKLINKINAENADIVLFTGDLIDRIYQYDNLEKVSKELSKIKSKYGNFAVWGNHDYGGGGRKSYIEGVDYSKKSVFENIMSEGNFKLLVNESVKINTNVGEIVITGLDDAIFGKINYKNVYKDNDLYHVVMAHESDVYEKVKDNNINLFLSGHSHGGQVRFPIIGGIISPPYGKKYVYEMYDEDETKIYVSSGIGTTHLHARLFNPPSYTVFEIGK